MGLNHERDRLDWLTYVATRAVRDAEDYPEHADWLLRTADFYADEIGKL